MSTAREWTTSVELAQLIRDTSLELIAEGGSGHPGGSLSLADVLAVVCSLDQPSSRMRILLSKGHAAPALYAALLHTGVLQGEGLVLRQLGSPLQGHPDRRFCTALEISSGSLGQGASMAVGLAYSLRLRGSSDQVVALLGDGELQEGQVWEAVMSAAHFGLGNLTFVVDANGVQHDGRVEDVLSLGNPGEIAARFAAFGWRACTVDGHDHDQLRSALGEDRALSRPRAIVADTVKGKGVPFMEDRVEWHSLADPAALADHLAVRARA